MTSIAFDFDDIRRRRNQLLGLAPTGRVFGREGEIVGDPDFSEIDHGRPLNWRMNQHRAAERAKCPPPFIGIDFASGDDATSWVQKRWWKEGAGGNAGQGPTWILLGQPPPRIPDWFKMAYRDPCSHPVRFKPSGMTATIISAKAMKMISGEERLLQVELFWLGGTLHTYAGDVFLKNFELVEVE